LKEVAVAARPAGNGPSYRVKPARPRREPSAADAPTSSLSPTSQPKILRPPPYPKARTQLEAGDTRRRDGAGDDGDDGDAGDAGDAGARRGRTCRGRTRPPTSPCRRHPAPPHADRPTRTETAVPEMVPVQGSRAGDRDHAATRFRAARTPGRHRPGADTKEPGHRPNNRIPQTLGVASSASI
jgi:hypothetical protein